MGSLGLAVDSPAPLGLKAQMPPRKKVDHRRGGGSKHVSSFDEVKARNAGEETAYDKARRRNKEKDEADEESASEEEASSSKQTAGASSAAKRVGVGGLEVENPNAVRRNEDKEGVELTRKQREEIEKAAARRRYEELHKAGKTDEAKADLARLEEVRKRREEAAQKRSEEEAKTKVKEAGPGISRDAVIKELKEAMGGEAARMPGDRSKKKDEKDADEKEVQGGPEDAPKKKIINGVDEGEVYAFVSTAGPKAPVEPGEKPKADGSIEACRAAEADFM